MGAAGRTLRGRLADMSPGVQLVGVTCLLLLVYLPTASTTVSTQTNDTFATALPAAHVARHGNLTLDAHEGSVTWLVEADGRLVSNRFPGTIAYAIPFYWLLDSGTDHRPPLWPGALAAALAAALAMGILSLALRHVTSPPTAVTAALIAGLGTSTWAISANALWPHGPSQALLAGVLAALAADGVATVGLLSAAVIVVSPNLAVVPATTGIGRTWETRTIRPAAVIGALAVLGLVAYLSYVAVVFGAGSSSPSSVPQVAGGYDDQWIEGLLHMPWTEYLENLAGTLVSPSRGILVLSPFLVVLLPGLRPAWQAAPSWVRLGAVSGVLTLLLELRMMHFSGGGGLFVYRRPLEMLTLSAPLLVGAYQAWTARRRWRRYLFWVLIGLSAAVQLLAAAMIDLPPTGVPQPEWKLIEWEVGWNQIGTRMPVVLVAGALAGIALAGVLERGRRDARPSPGAPRSFTGDGAP